MAYFSAPIDTKKRPKLEFRGPKLARFPAFFDQKRPKLGVAP